jgi:hypothetical protein
MQLLSLNKRPHQRPLRLSRRELSALRRWLAATARGRLSSSCPSIQQVRHLPGYDRRDIERQPFETTAELRPISAGGIGLVQPASVCDVSADGIAFRTSMALTSGQRLSIEVRPPANLPSRLVRGAEQPVHLLAIVRYCRPEGGGFVVGCSIGVEWSASLANQMFPAEMAALRKSA